MNAAKPIEILISDFQRFSELFEIFGRFLCNGPGCYPTWVWPLAEGGGQIWIQLYSHLVYFISVRILHIVCLIPVIVTHWNSNIMESILLLSVDKNINTKTKYSEWSLSYHTSRFFAENTVSEASYHTAKFLLRKHRVTPWCNPAPYNEGTCIHGNYKQFTYSLHIKLSLFSIFLKSLYFFEWINQNIHT